MSTSTNQTTVDEVNDYFEFPVAAIVCLTVIAYVFLVIIFLIIRQMLVSKGSCQSDCHCPKNIINCTNSGAIGKAFVLFSCCSNPEGCLAASHCSTKLCSALKLGGLHCCNCKSVRCCAYKPQCPSCFSNDLHPDACVFLCLEIKLRTSCCGSVNVSASPKDNHIQHDRSLEPSGRTVVDNRNIGQVSSQLNEDSTSRKLEIYPNGVSRTSSPMKSTSHNQQRSTNKLTNNKNLVIFTADTLDDQRQPTDIINSHVNFQGPLEGLHHENENTRPLSLPLVISRSLSGDSAKQCSSRSYSYWSSNSGADFDRYRRSISRSSRPVHPGQKSQRFPNKILVSSESLRVSRDTAITVTSEDSHTQNPQKHLSDPSTHLDFKSHRPLPSIRKTC